MYNSIACSRLVCLIPMTMSCGFIVCEKTRLCFACNSFDGEDLHDKRAAIVNSTQEALAVVEG